MKGTNQRLVQRRVAWHPDTRQQRCCEIAGHRLKRERKPVPLCQEVAFFLYVCVFPFPRRVSGSFCKFKFSFFFFFIQFKFFKIYLFVPYYTSIFFQNLNRILFPLVNKISLTGLRPYRVTLSPENIEIQCQTPVLQ